MAWYDPILILTFVTGLLIMAFSHHSDYHHRRAITWGVILMIGSLIIKVFLWLESMLGFVN